LKKTIQHIFFAGILLLLLFSCNKSQVAIAPINHPGSSSPQFIKYTIRGGQQYCDQSVYKQTNFSELKFAVKFDSTAIYQTVSPGNQYDVNKLYGFSDNNDEHHHFSARFGWRWSEGALRLFGYVYNNGVMNFEELGTVSIGIEYTCSIKVTAANYIFTLNNTSKNMPRASTTASAVGYQLYPYFGGDETAPHDITIWIKQL
jgi:hypothetical protein